MNPDKQRIAIAEACGHRRFTAPCALLDARECDEHVEVPDYLNDLNAMHEAEKVLTESQWSEYGSYLIKYTKPHAGPGLWNHRHVHATAAQRAEAFLRTIGKWEGA